MSDILPWREDDSATAAARKRGEVQRKMSQRVEQMLEVFDDAMGDDDIRVRLQAALGLLPYMIPKMKPKEVEGEEGVVETDVRRSLREEIQGIVKPSGSSGVL